MSHEFAHPVELIREYGSRYPEQFGGVYMEAGKFVVLFTDDLATHEAAVRALLAEPDELLIRRGARSWQAIEHSNQEVARVLLIDEHRSGVSGVGIGVRSEQFVVMVSIDPYDAERVAEIERLVQPHAVVVRHTGRGRYA